MEGEGCGWKHNLRNVVSAHLATVTHLLALGRIKTKEGEGFFHIQGYVLEAGKGNVSVDRIGQSFMQTLRAEAKLHGDFYLATFVHTEIII